MENGVDITSEISSISVVDGAVVLAFDKPLRGASYQLTARDSIEDTLGNHLDGDSDGEPGGDFVRTFGVHQGVFGVGGIISVSDIDTTQANSLNNSAFVTPQGGFDIGWAAWTDQSIRDVVRRFDQTGAPLGSSFPIGTLGLTDLAEDPWGNIVTGGTTTHPRLPGSKSSIRRDNSWTASPSFKIRTSAFPSLRSR